MVNQKEGAGQATADEVELALNRDHGVDNPESIAFFRSIFKSSKIVIWKYGFKSLRDGWMVKLQFVQTIEVQKGKKTVQTILGPITRKGYFSDIIYGEFKKKILAIPKRTRRDMSHPNDSEFDIEYPKEFAKVKTHIQPKLKLKDIWD